MNYTSTHCYNLHTVLTARGPLTGTLDSMGANEPDEQKAMDYGSLSGEALPSHYHKVVFVYMQYAAVQGSHCR